MNRRLLHSVAQQGRDAAAGQVGSTRARGAARAIVHANRERTTRSRARSICYDTTRAPDTCTVHVSPGAAFSREDRVRSARALDSESRPSLRADSMQRFRAFHS